MSVYLYFSLALATAYALLMLCYMYGLRLQRKEQLPKDAAQEKMPLFSIVIAARNESKRIEACLQSILANNYPRHLFEIILVDDFSEDDTAAKAARLLQTPDRLIKLSDIITKSERLNAFKKRALAEGVKCARGSYIITTDADCVVPNQWMACFAAALAAHPSLHCIAAPVNFTPAGAKRNWLYYFQSVDFMTMQGITVASNRLGLGNMSNGANFLFSKAAFNAVGGYEGIDKKASGDDMMLLQKIDRAFPNSLSFLYHEQAIVNTPVQPDWSSFLNQRIRWASKADSYPQRRMTMVLALVYFFNLNFLPLIVNAMFNAHVLMVLVCILLLKVLAELIFVWPLANFFEKRNELFFLIILQPLHIAYIIAAGFLGKMGHYEWKGRQVY